MGRTAGSVAEGRVSMERCETCTKKCPQMELADECAKGRMYATKELIECQKELQAFKDKQEQGLLLLLPVAEGTEVWCIGSCGEICDNWSIDCSNCEEHQVVFCTNFDRNMTEQWGITVFPTKAEAEEALAKMGGK